MVNGSRKKAINHIKILNHPWVSKFTHESHLSDDYVLLLLCVLYRMYERVCTLYTFMYLNDFKICRQARMTCRCVLTSWRRWEKNSRAEKNLLWIWQHARARRLPLIKIVIVVKNIRAIHSTYDFSHSLSLHSQLWRECVWKVFSFFF